MAEHSWRTASFALALLGYAASSHAEPFRFTLNGVKRHQEPIQGRH